LPSKQLPLAQSAAQPQALPAPYSESATGFRQPSGGAAVPPLSREPTIGVSPSEVLQATSARLKNRAAQPINVANDPECAPDWGRVAAE
jgi:hypothetical protein